MLAKLDAVELVLLVGGIAVIGYGAMMVFGTKGPHITFSPNPVRGSYSGMVTGTARGLGPNENLTVRITKPDGTLLSEMTEITNPDNTTIPIRTDENGVFTTAPMEAMGLKLLALLAGTTIFDITATGQTSGLVARGRLVIEIGAATAAILRQYGGRQSSIASSFFGSMVSPQQMLVSI